LNLWPCGHQKLFHLLLRNVPTHHSYGWHDQACFLVHIHGGAIAIATVIKIVKAAWQPTCAEITGDFVVESKAGMIAFGFRDCALKVLGTISLNHSHRGISSG
jgi:hypothetical protein